MPSRVPPRPVPGNTTDFARLAGPLIHAHLKALPQTAERARLVIAMQDAIIAQDDPALTAYIREFALLEPHLDSATVLRDLTGFHVQ